MGLCYSLRPRLFGDLSGSISNATSDSDQPPEPPVPSRAGGPRQEDTGGCGETSSLRGGSQVRHGDSAKLPAGEHRRGDTVTDGVLIQNGGGGKGTGKDRGRRLPLLQKPSTPKPKNWDKLLAEQKEAAREASRVSREIDIKLKELKREYKQTHRLLLLGLVKMTRFPGSFTKLCVSFIMNILAEYSGYDRLPCQHLSSTSTEI